MSELFEKSIRTLELPRVLELLAEQAVSAEAKARCRRLRPETEPEEVLRLLDQTDAARQMMGLRGSPSFSGVKPVAEALDRADLTPEQRALLTAPVEVTVTGGQTGEGEAMGLLSMLLPFASLMLLYFLVLLYGQSTAASVILEKTSKLMDLFLVSVEPGAMVLGKVLATALAGLLQLAVWAAGLAGGFAIGGAVVRQTGVTLPLLEVLKGVGRLTGLFSAPAMLEAAGLLLAGFLLYCSLSAIGGSMAGKAEDLSSTNVLFSLVLVASFFCCMFAGGMDGMTSSARWLDYVPFTAILVTPSRVLLGQTSLLGGLVSLALVVVCAGVLTALAGRVYRLMSLYKGNPPTPRRVLRMLREK